MKYEKKNGKYIFNKDGVYFALTVEQCDDMLHSILEIQRAENPRWVCIVDGEDDPIDYCVWDEGNISDCSIACSGVKKADCKHWKAI
jgi:hypothetical protein